MPLTSTCLGPSLITKEQTGSFDNLTPPGVPFTFFCASGCNAWVPLIEINR